MKKYLATLIIAGFFIACNDSSSDDSSTSGDSTAPVVATPDTSSSAAAGDMKDGVMQLKDGKVVMLSAGNWEPLQDTVTCTNGRKVAPNGEVSKGDRKRMLTEGMMIDRDGQIMDKDGKLVDNTGWE